MVSTYFEIPPGDLYGDTIATAIIPGAEANGLPEGSINVLVDQVAYIASVTNTTVSAGGAGVESDDDFTRRIYNAPLAYSVAGPRGAYEYWRANRAPILRTCSPGRRLRRTFRLFFCWREALRLARRILRRWKHTSPRILSAPLQIA